MGGSGSKPVTTTAIPTTTTTRSTAATITTRTATTPQYVNSRYPLEIIIPAATVGFLLFITVLAAVVLCKKRKKALANKQAESRDRVAEDTAGGQQVDQGYAQYDQDGHSKSGPETKCEYAIIRLPEANSVTYSHVVFR